MSWAKNLEALDVLSKISIHWFQLQRQNDVSMIEWIWLYKWIRLNFQVELIELIWHLKK